MDYLNTRMIRWYQDHNLTESDVDYWLERMSVTHAAKSILGGV